ncbi:MAG: glycosyltransferase [Anaerolineae bacterium]|nr:glycosyltransferase [Caldilineales bacterium]MDW8267749.1 glycosyltransferase [Anaerolineae bacterium]
MPCRLLCVAVDLPGHLDWGGYLATTQALARRGHEVLWVSGEAVGPRIAAAGLPFVPLPTIGWRHDLPPLLPQRDSAQREQARRERALAVWLDPEAVGRALTGLLAVAQAFRPDRVLVEPFAAAGVLLAEKLDLPLVVVGRPALPPAAAGEGAPPLVRAAVTRLCETAGVSGRYWDLQRGLPTSPRLHLDFFCRPWYADLPAIGPQTVFCGGLPAVPIRRQRRPATVLVTLGSTFRDDPAFFRLAAQAVIAAGARPLVVTGGQGDVPGLPAGCEVMPWVEYAAVFPRLAAVIHHGGVATTHAALVYGVPQLVVPHAGDQYAQAGRVTQAGVGYGVRPRDFTAATAAPLLASLLNDPGFRVAAQHWAHEMHALGGIETAVAAVEGDDGRLT